MESANEDATSTWRCDISQVVVATETDPTDFSWEKDSLGSQTPWDCPADTIAVAPPKGRTFSQKLQRRFSC